MPNKKVGVELSIDKEKFAKSFVDAWKAGEQRINRLSGTSQLGTKGTLVESAAHRTLGGGYLVGEQERRLRALRTQHHEAMLKLRQDRRDSTSAAERREIGRSMIAERASFQTSSLSLQRTIASERYDMRRRQMQEQALRFGSSEGIAEATGSFSQKMALARQIHRVEKAGTLFDSSRGDAQFGAEFGTFGSADRAKHIGRMSSGKAMYKAQRQEMLKESLLLIPNMVTAVVASAAMTSFMRDTSYAAAKVVRARSETDMISPYMRMYGSLAGAAFGGMYGGIIGGAAGLGGGLLSGKVGGAAAAGRVAGPVGAAGMAVGQSLLGIVKGGVQGGLLGAGVGSAILGQAGELYGDVAERWIKSRSALSSAVARAGYFGGTHIDPSRAPSLVGMGASSAEVADTMANANLVWGGGLRMSRGRAVGVGGGGGIRRRARGASAGIGAPIIHPSEFYDLTRPSSISDQVQGVSDAQRAQMAARTGDASVLGGPSIAPGEGSQRKYTLGDFGNDLLTGADRLVTGTIGTVGYFAAGLGAATGMGLYKGFEKGSVWEGLKAAGDAIEWSGGKMNEQLAYAFLGGPGDAKSSPRMGPPSLSQSHAAAGITTGVAPRNAYGDEPFTQALKKLYGDSFMKNLAPGILSLDPTTMGTPTTPAKTYLAMADRALRAQGLNASMVRSRTPIAAQNYARQVELFQNITGGVMSERSPAFNASAQFLDTVSQATGIGHGDARLANIAKRTLGTYRAPKSDFMNAIKFTSILGSGFNGDILDLYNRAQDPTQAAQGLTGMKDVLRGVLGNRLGKVAFMNEMRKQNVGHEAAARLYDTDLTTGSFKAITDAENIASGRRTVDAAERVTGEEEKKQAELATLIPAAKDIDEVLTQLADTFGKLGVNAKSFNEILKRFLEWVDALGFIGPSANMAQRLMNQLTSGVANRIDPSDG